ncbi:MAG TPA: flagellar basal body rod protein FlgC [Porticoccaceae bacterium]|nr:flagellar basal body rod protein FlgC [Porticoccaceae bacterium]
MSLFGLLEVSGSALSAQSVRLNTISSNLANAESVSGSPEAAYRARQPVFSSVHRQFSDPTSADALVGVRVDRIVESSAVPRKEYAPSHPLADDDGYIYFGNVNAVEEMANMISASRSYQNSVEVMNTSKQLLLQTLNIGR